jgi:hypothetical protein
MQAQDYAGAKWAIGLRVPGLNDADVESAFDAGTILRTHVLRPTWHFVTPADIRWMLRLTAPRVHAFNAPYYRREGLDRATLARFRRRVERALAREPFLTREQIASATAAGGVALKGLALALALMDAELEGVICSGPRSGRQFTYALLDRRARSQPVRTPDEALGELTRRYFTSHGPATLKDFAWWSGLTQREGRRGVEISGGSLSSETVAGLTYWSAGDRSGPRASHSTHLLPNYDEFLIAYQDRGLSAPSAAVSRPPRDDFAHQAVIDGRVAGSWKRRVARTGVDVEIACYSPPAPEVRRGIERAAARYGAFLGVEARVRFAAR